MKKCRFLSLFLSFICFASSGQQAFAPDRLIARMNTSCDAIYMIDDMMFFNIPVVDALNREYHCRKIRKVPLHKPGAPQIWVLEFAHSIDIPKAIERYMETGMFKYVEPDYAGEGAGTTATSVNDTKFSKQWGLYNDGAYTFPGVKAGADIKIKEAWDIETGDSNIVVAVADAGFKMNHPDAAGRLWKNTGEIAGNNLDDDGNGYKDDVDGWNFAYNNKTVTDDHGHGTNVASVIGANANNNNGIAGIDWHCKLMILKVLNATNGGQTTWMNDAIAYATDKEADIINLSLQNYPFSQSTKDLVDFAYGQGITIVACMGNGNTGSVSYPAGYDHVIAVGATNPADRRANPFCWGGGSNYGSHISVVAPGDYIEGLSYNSDVTTEAWCGTSQATPMVSALCALLLAQDTSRTPDSLKDIIEKTADDMVGLLTEDQPGFDNYYGHGRINAYKALMYAVAPPGSVENIISQNMRVYPNPAKDKVYIRNSGSTARYTLQSTLGTIVATGLATNGNTEIDITQLCAGIYFISLRVDEARYVEKLIVD